MRPKLEEQREEGPAEEIDLELGCSHRLELPPDVGQPVVLAMVLRHRGDYAEGSTAAVDSIRETLSVAFPQGVLTR